VLVSVVFAGWMFLLGPALDDSYGEDKAAREAEALLNKKKNEDFAAQHPSPVKKEQLFWESHRKHLKENSKPKFFSSTKAVKAVDEANYEAESDDIPLNPASDFLRGDVNQDGQVSIEDAITLLKLFSTSGYEPSCLASADVNNDGRIQPGDAMQLIIYTTRGIRPPVSPFPNCGKDIGSSQASPGLGCDFYESCLEIELEQAEDELEDEDTLSEEDEREDSEEEDGEEEEEEAAAEAAAEEEEEEEEEEE